MNGLLSNFVWGTVCLAVGVLILQNLDALVLSDKHFGIRQKAWFQKTFGNTFLNREIWPFGTRGGFPPSKISKIVFRVLGAVFVLRGALYLLEPVIVRLYFRSHFH
jgi:hypothetical protein